MWGDLSSRILPFVWQFRMHRRICEPSSPINGRSICIYDVDDTIAIVLVVGRIFLRPSANRRCMRRSSGRSFKRLERDPEK